MPGRIDSILPYACCKDIKHFVVYDLDLPFDLNASFDYHEITVKNLDVDFLNNNKRSIVLKSERLWQESTNICGRDVVQVNITNYNSNKIVYTSVITSLQIMVPIFDNEMETFLEAFKSHDNIALLLSNIMYILKNKFNEVLATDFVFDVSTYGAERAAVYELTNDFDRLHLINGVISPRYSFRQEKKMSQGTINSIKEDSFCMWRLFANKCEIAYNLNQNLDCILFAAISIESYVESLFINFGLKNTYDTLFKAIKHLKESKNIESKEHKRIEAAFGKINRFRNDIVHGKIGTIIQERTKARIAYETIVEFYSNKPQQLDNVRPPRYGSIYKKFNDIVRIIRTGDFKSQVDNLIKFANSGYFVQSANFYLGVCFFQTANYDFAKRYFIKCRDAKRYYIQSIYYLALIAKISNNQSNLIKIINEGKEYINSLKNKEPLHASIDEAFGLIMKEDNRIPRYRCI